VKGVISTLSQKPVLSGTPSVCMDVTLSLLLAAATAVVSFRKKEAKDGDAFVEHRFAQHCQGTARGAGATRASSCSEVHLARPIAAISLLISSTLIALAALTREEPSCHIEHCARYVDR
jgi:hypothetical protein